MSHWEKVKAIIAAARAAGTHSDEVRAVCDGCGQWCDGHYVGTGHGRGLGKCCAPKPKPPDPIQSLGPSTLVLITPPAPKPREPPR